MKVRTEFPNVWREYKNHSNLYIIQGIPYLVIFRVQRPIMSWPEYVMGCLHGPSRNSYYIFIVSTSPYKPHANKNGIYVHSKYTLLTAYGYVYPTNQHMIHTEGQDAGVIIGNTLHYM